jgi:hypothetical protein
MMAKTKSRKQHTIQAPIDPKDYSLTLAMQDAYLKYITTPVINPVPEKRDRDFLSPPVVPIAIREPTPREVTMALNDLPKKWRKQISGIEWE